MRKEQAKRLFSLCLAALMFVFAVLPVSAAETTAAARRTDKTLAELTEAFNAASYEEYRESLTDHYDVNAALAKVTGKSLAEIEELTLRQRSALIAENLTAMNKLLRTGETISVDVMNGVNDEETDAEGLEVLEYTDANGESKKALLVPGGGTVTWDIDVKEAGLYGLRIEFCAASSKKNSIERNFYINGAVPFEEARTLIMTKTWRVGQDNYTQVNSVGAYEDPAEFSKYCFVGLDGKLYRFATDSAGNEIKPASTVSAEWTTYEFIDSDGMYIDPFEFYFEEGANTIALRGVREEMYVASIELFTVEDNKSYEEYVEEMKAKGGDAEGTDSILIQAELPSAVSNYTIYPIYDRSSAITQPQHSTMVLNNTIGSDKWESAGQWIEYTFTVENAGWYSIATRFKQSELAGLFVSRSLYIDGEIPFDAAASLQFDFNESWQIGYLGGDAPYKFYLDAGEHTIRFTVTMGHMGSTINRVSNIVDSLNQSYLEILKLTGSDPDEYRDYGFTRVMPDTIRNLLIQRDNLKEVQALLEGEKGVNANTVVFQQLITLLNKMGSDENNIAKNLTELKDQLGTLGEWVNGVNVQPLELDYIMVQPSSTELPKANASFFQALWYQLQQFFGSFFTDYNSLGTGAAGDNSVTVEVWVQSGRDQAQITRSIIQNEYSSAVITLKLVAAGTLLPSVLAGVGPDVSLDGAQASGSINATLTQQVSQQADVVSFAIRNAVEDLTQFDREYLDSLGYTNVPSFDEVVTRFSPASLTPLTLYGSTYGLPAKQTFPMMFVRTDILANLGEEIPTTWDELMALLPVLQYNNMEIGLTADYTIYLYQMGSELWADDGMRVNMDANDALAAFEMMCDMFTQYSLPYSYDPANRFRTGEMPIFIAEYETNYNKLVVFATEIAGQWSMAPVPGMYDSEGNLNNLVVSTVTGAMLLRGSEHKEAAWEFLAWYTDKDFQVEYSNELVAVVGPAAKNATANMAALEELDWTHDEYEALYEQMQNLEAVEAYPGSYILSRYINFSFLDAYNENANPTDALLDNISAINKEVTRKRKEFDLETLLSGQTLAEKRMEQAIDAMNGLSASLKSTYEAEITAAKKAIEAKDADALLDAAKAFAAAVKANGGYRYSDTASVSEVTIGYTALDSDDEPIWVVTVKSSGKTVESGSDAWTVLMISKYLYDAAAFI